MSALKISLVTPCLNGALTIDRTLDSIAAQNYPNLEYIVRDGASSDATVEKVRARDAWVASFISEKDTGPAQALNKGFAAATGDIFGYLNADDELAPGALGAVAGFFEANPNVDVVTGGCRRVFADGAETLTQPQDPYVELLPYRNYFEQPSTFWRAALHRRAGAFDETYKLVFDWEWWNRLKRSGAQFARVQDVLSVYHFSADNITSRAGQRTIDEMYRVTKAYAPNGAAIADAYKFLFGVFDMHGYYDKPFAQLTPPRKLVFGATLTGLYALYGRKAVNAYNWNWVSKQMRGIKWYG